MARKKSTAKKSSGMTSRQRQSQQIMREKAAQKKRQALLRKLYVVGGAALGMAVIAAGAWCWQTSAISRAADSVVDGAYGLTADAGFAVNSLYLEGRSRSSMKEINRALDIKKGDPILRISLDEVRGRLEHIESISHATVERTLPDKVYVRIVEREPVALWQNQGKIALVDDNGVVMTGLDMEPYKHLPLIIGSDAPDHVREVLGLLASQPDLARRFSAAIRVGARRWNIRIANRQNDVIEIKLPESDVAKAWQKLAELQEKEQVLDRDVQEIDLRLDGRMFIKLAPDESPARKNRNARDA
jgi:cell division protein FtsQ